MQARGTKLIGIFGLLALALLLIAAVPSFQDFNTSQFSSAPSAVSITKDAQTTNLHSQGFLYTGTLLMTNGIQDTNVAATVVVWSGQTFGGQSDGMLQISLSSAPFYGTVSNSASAGPGVDTVIVGNPPGMGATGDEQQILKLRDSAILGHHCANYGTNIDECVFIGWAAGLGLQGNGPFFYKDDVIIGTDAGPFGSPFCLQTFCLGTLSGSAWGNSTNSVAIGYAAGAGVGGVVNNRDLVIGGSCDLPFGNSGEASIMNSLFATNLDLNGGGNWGVGTKNPSTRLEVAGPIAIEATTAPTMSGSTCAIWNSNKVLYGVSSTQTKLIIDLR